MLINFPLRTITCRYRNQTNQFQVAKLTNQPQLYEFTLMPNQELIFQALPTALLEIYTYEYATMMISDRLPCQSLYLQPDVELLAS